MPPAMLTRRGLLSFLGLGGFMTVPDFPDEKAPDAHATAISLTGAPLLGLKTVLGSNAAGLAIPGNGGPNLVSSAPVGQIGYEMLFSISTAAVVAAPLAIAVEWNDAATGLLTDTQTWTMFAGKTAFPHVIRLTGPINGDRLTVLIANGPQAITVKYTIMQTSRVYTRHFGHTINLDFSLPQFPGFTFASGDPSSLILAAESDSVAASSSVSRLLPLYSGTARMWGRASDGTGSNSEWRLQYDSALVSVGDTIAYQVLGNSGFSPAGQGSMAVDNVAMPRSQLTAALVNHNTTTANTMELHLIAREVAA